MQGLRPCHINHEGLPLSGDSVSMRKPPLKEGSTSGPSLEPNTERLLVIEALDDPLRMVAL